MNEILKKISIKLEKSGVDYQYEQGSGNLEYDTPDTLILRSGRYEVHVSCKLGSSWYLSTGSGIRIATVGFKEFSRSPWYAWSYRYLDITSDDDHLVDWVMKTIKKTTIPKYSPVSWERVKSDWRSVCHDVSRILCEELPNTFTRGMIKSPKIEYRHDDMFDEIFDMSVLEIKFPRVDPKQPIKSLIFQERRYDNGEVRIFMNLRYLTPNDPPLLISISNEVEVPRSGTRDIVDEEFKKYIREDLYPIIPVEVRKRIEC